MGDFSYARRFDFLPQTEYSKRNVKRHVVRSPVHWSDTAVSIVASKYLRPSDNNDIERMIDRVVGTIKKYLTQRYHYDEATKASQDLKAVIEHQLFSFNSPVWFNLGIHDRPQISACFINSLEDNMDSILDLSRVEGNIFKNGGGSGVNVSNLRPSGSPLSGGGKASGPLSFMKAWDASAGSIKSGGRTRRAAVMRIMDSDHPDIYDFINCKIEEEKKAKALITAGYDGSIDGEAYGTVAFQNANHTVRFVGDWKTDDRLLNAIANAIHDCGDPGVQFSDNINDAHRCPDAGPIVASNPCQPGFAKVITPNGIRNIDDVKVGDYIWGKNQWTKITKKINRGVKKVFSYNTTVGSFVGTSDHKVLSKGVKTPVKDVKEIDVSPLPVEMDGLDDNIQDVMDGLVFGDGSVHKASNNLVYLLVGKDDKDWLNSEVRYLFRKPRPGLTKEAHEIITTIKPHEIPKTYERIIPDRFYYGKQRKVRGFLRGLYSANGSICDKRITLKASSFNVVKQVQTMLLTLGIRSYYTINKPKVVNFSNGNYYCKASYDLNITSNRDLFKTHIGFIQTHKNKKLENACKTKSKPRKKSYEIKNKSYLGEYEVYDLTVDNKEHVYTTDGLLVANCGEFLFPNDSACNLGSINLLGLDQKSNGFFQERLCDLIHLAIVCMDTLIDFASYPTESIRDNSIEWRPLGLGVTNYAAYVMAMGQSYSDVPLNIFYEIQQQTRRTKQSLREWSGQDYPDTQLTVIAPTGTISLMMDCETTGIEPYMSLNSTKHLVGGGSLKYEQSVLQKAIEKHGKQWVARQCALEPGGLSVSEHLDVLQDVQPYIDGGISKTINVPEECSVDDIKQIILDAHKRGLKSLTIYRNNSKGSQPIEAGEKKSTVKTYLTNGRLRLSDERQSITHRFSVGSLEGYLTVGLYDDGSPGELFITISKEGSTISGLCDSIGILTSMSLQHGVPLIGIVNKLKGMSFEPSGITGHEKIRLAKSLSDYIARWLELKFLNNDVSDDHQSSGNLCPDCGSELMQTGTCQLCPSCGLSGGCG